MRYLPTISSRTEQKESAHENSGKSKLAIGKNRHTASSAWVEA